MSVWNYTVFYITPVMIMIALAVIVYMLSRLLKNKQMIAWANIELYQVFFSIALLVGILILSDIFHSYIVPSLVESAVPSFRAKNMTSYDISIMYLNRVATDGLRIMNELVGLKIIVQQVSSIIFPLPIEQITFEMPVSDISCLDKALSYVFMLLSPFVSSVFAQMFGIKIFQVLMFPVVLPVGIFLRIFPQTRDAGSYMIAIALGFHLIFPLMYCVNYVYMDRVYSGTSQMFDPLGIQSFVERLNDSMQHGEAFQFLKMIGVFNPAAFMTIFVTQVLDHLVSLPKEAGFVVLNGFILPTLNIILTVSFIKSLQKYMVRRFG